ncbi:hypothetical protein Golob_017753, partial [Gossypium lobatum]|nr:hypothetical protein [Gossypium lobatum]
NSAKRHRSAAKRWKVSFFFQRTPFDPAYLSGDSEQRYLEQVAGWWRRDVTEACEARWQVGIAGANGMCSGGGSRLGRRQRLEDPRDGDQRRTRSIFSATSVQLHWRTLVYNLVYRSMGMSLRGTTVSADWSATCEQLLGKVPNKFKGSQIEMGWLENNFEHIEAFTSDVEKEQFVLAFILRLIGSLLMLDKFHNMAHLRWLLLLADLKEAR